MIQNGGQHTTQLGRLLAVFVLLLAGLCPSVFARVETIENYPVAPFRIVDQAGEAGFIYDYIGERDSGDGGTFTFNNNTFEEYILYKMRAYVYHPRLLDITSQVKLGLIQQFISNTGIGEEALKSGSSNTGVIAYNLYMSFFKEHPFSFAVFANHDREPVLELFTDRILTESNGYGATFNWKKAPVPMDLTLSQNRFREWGFESNSVSRIKTLDYSARNDVGNWMHTELSYHYQDYIQDFDAESEQFKTHQHTRLKTNETNLFNTIFFDQAHHYQLYSNLRYFSESGSQELNTWSLQERLNLQHTRNLRTYYLFNTLRNNIKENTISAYRAEAGLDHKLYESLDEHVDFHWRESDFAGTTAKQYGPTARLGYRKQTPWGNLSASYARTIEKVENKGTDDIVPVSQESVTMLLETNNFLNETGIDVHSIEVTSVDDTVVFQQGFDFDVVEMGGRVALRIVPGGRIANNQTVHVGFNMNINNNTSYISDDQNFNVNYDFLKYLDGLSVYYRWHDLGAHDISGNSDNLDILTYNDKLGGFAYRWRWLTWREEYQVYRSNFDDYNQLLSEVEGLHMIGSQLRLSWRAGYQNTNYVNTSGLPHGATYDNSLFAAVGVRGPIRTTGFWEVEGDARKETGQFNETLLGAVGKLGFRWRKARVEAGMRYEDCKRFESTIDRYNIFLQFSREF